MTERDERTNQWSKIESHLYQIKILLLILIAACVLGVYGISRSMWDDVAASVTSVCEAVMGIGLLIAPVPLIFWGRAICSLSRTRADTSDSPSPET